MAQRKTQGKSNVGKLIAIGIPLLTFIAGNVVNGFNLAASVAKKDDVKEVLKISTDYTDQKSREFLKSANDYTEAKNQAVMLKIEEMRTDVKSTEMGLITQVQSLQKSIEDLRSDIRIDSNNKGRDRSR